MARFGMLTPSSNTVLEPVTTAMLHDVPTATAHFSRFKVTEIALTSQALGQFDDSEILKAAELLAHAKVDVIAWNGTSASWLGFDSDERLCERITSATGIKACTSVLAFREIYQLTEVRLLGLVTPYREDVQQKIEQNLATIGITCPAERHLGLQDNFSFAETSEETIKRMVREVGKAGCDAIAIVCTNMRGAALVPAMEREIGIPIYDSVAVTLWKCLQVTGTDPGGLRNWGRLFGLGSESRVTAKQMSGS